MFDIPERYFHSSKMKTKFGHKLSEFTYIEIIDKGRIQGTTLKEFRIVI